MNILLRITLIFVTSLALVSCQSSLTPVQVTEKFWQSVQNRDLHQVREFITDGVNLDQDDLDTLPQFDFVSTGKIVIDGDRANVDTILVMQSAENTNTSLDTHLLMQNNRWQVDYHSTVQPLMTEKEMSRLMDDIELMTDEFAEGIEHSVEEIKEKVMPEIKSRMEDMQEEIREKLPELKRSIDEFLRELEKSIEESTPPPEEDVTIET